MMNAPIGEPLTGVAAAALDLLPQSIYIVDRNLDVVAWNSSREQGPLGLSRVRALGRNLRDVLSPAGLASAMPALTHVLETATSYEEARTSFGGRYYLVRRLPISDGRTVTHVLTVSEEVVPDDTASATPVPGGAVAVVISRVAGDVVLDGIVPVCAWCKKIREPRGEWLQVETFLAQRSHAVFTHGICPDCSGRTRSAEGRAS
jgi:hypothetical protein